MARVGKGECIGSHYLMLGLKRSASEREIKDRYRELAKIYHPDVNHSRDAEEKFKQINEAYNYLISHIGDKSYSHDAYSHDEEIFNEIKRTNKTNKKDISDITDEILRDISKSVRKDIHKNLQKNLQKFMKKRNRVIYTAAVKSIKKEMKRIF